MLDKETTAHNLALLRIQAEKSEALSDEDLHARYVELYNEFLKIGKNYERNTEHLQSLASMFSPLSVMV